MIKQMLSQPLISVSLEETFSKSYSCPSLTVFTHSRRLNENQPRHNSVFSRPIISHSSMVFPTQLLRRGKLRSEAKRTHDGSQSCMSPRISPHLNRRCDSFETPPPVKYLSLSPPPLRRRRLNEEYLDASNLEHSFLPILPSEKMAGFQSALEVPRLDQRSSQPFYPKLRPRFQSSSEGLRRRMASNYAKQDRSFPSIMIQAAEYLELLKGEEMLNNTAEIYHQRERRAKKPIKQARVVLSPTSTRRGAFDGDHISFVTRFVDESCCSALQNDISLSEFY